MQILLQNLQVLLEIDIILLEGKYSVLANFSGRNTFSKIVALTGLEGRISCEVDKAYFTHILKVPSTPEGPSPSTTSRVSRKGTVSGIQFL